MRHKALELLVGVEPRPASISMRESATSCTSGNKHILTYFTLNWSWKAARFPHTKRWHWTTIVKIWITPKWLFNVVGPSQSNQQGPFDSAPLHPLVYKIPPNRKSIKGKLGEDNRTPFLCDRCYIIGCSCRRKCLNLIFFVFPYVQIPNRLWVRFWSPLSNYMDRFLFYSYWFLVDIGLIERQRVVPCIDAVLRVGFLFFLYTGHPLTTRLTGLQSRFTPRPGRIPLTLCR